MSKQPDLTVSRAAHTGQSEEVAASVGDTIAELRAALASMEVERNQWHDAFLASQAAGQLQRMEAKHRLDSLLIELAAARGIVEEARMRNPVEPCLCSDCSSWRALYAAYDAAVEARGR